MQKKEGTPLYLQVYEELQKRIESGVYKENEFLSSEAPSQAEFSINRITIRCSLQDLELVGFIKVQKGRGAMVLANRKYTDLVGVGSFPQDAMRSGERPSPIILEFEEMKASGIVCDYLQLQEGTDIYHLKCLRLGSGRTIGMDKQFISGQTGLELHADVLNKKTSIYVLYEEQGLHIGHTVESIGAVMPSTVLRKELYMNEGEPLFKRERIIYDCKNRPLELPINPYKADEYKYIITLKKDEL